jgi:23S rRNA pseudouridine2605 synthase
MQAMRINTFVASASQLSRRAADKAITSGRVTINQKPATLGQTVSSDDTVTLDGVVIRPPTTQTTIMLHKPVGYVVSRDGQGSKTIYDILPKQYQSLKPIGRLDKDSSGLLLLTNNGTLVQQLTHPSFQKQKVYEIRLSRPLSSTDKNLVDQGVRIDEYISHMKISGKDENWQITMAEGRNRQIRRTFEKLGYQVVSLYRNQFGPYKLNDLPAAHWKEI